MTTYSRVSTHGVRWYAAVTLGVGLFLAAQAAEAVTFSITEAVRTIGSGYGKDKNDAPETLLGVKFDDSFKLQSFSLNAGGQTFSFLLGTVTLTEPSNGGINADEINDLNVSWTLKFAGPLSVFETITATPFAAVGEINQDDSVDFALHWLPVTVDFGIDGQFEISLNDLEFDQSGTHRQLATITLLHLPTQPTREAAPPGASVPEPGTIALFALGLAGIGAARRKKPFQ